MHTFHLDNSACYFNDAISHNKCTGINTQDYFSRVLQAVVFLPDYKYLNFSKLDCPKLRKQGE